MKKNKSKDDLMCEKWQVVKKGAIDSIQFWFSFIYLFVFTQSVHKIRMSFKNIQINWRTWKHTHIFVQFSVYSMNDNWTKFVKKWILFYFQKLKTEKFGAKYFWIDTNAINLNALWFRFVCFGFEFDLILQIFKFNENTEILCGAEHIKK